MLLFVCLFLLWQQKRIFAFNRLFVGFSILWKLFYGVRFVFELKTAFTSVELIDAVAGRFEYDENRSYSRLPWQNVDLF